jgi:hypothetical protein
MDIDDMDRVLACLSHSAISQNRALQAMNEAKKLLQESRESCNRYKIAKHLDKSDFVSKCKDFFETTFFDRMSWGSECTQTEAAIYALNSLLTNVRENYCW